MITPEIQVSDSSPPAAATVTAGKGVADDHHRFSFHDLISAMNPLQYLPVVGTIYRAVTGDVIPEMLRRAGTLLVSGLMGGPIGVAINVVTTIAEKVSGIDPEKIVAAELGVTPPAASVRAVLPAAPAAAAKPQAPAAPVEAASAGSNGALSPQQLAAYGVRTGADGTMTLGQVSGADVLNALELVRLSKQAAAAYAANQIT